MVLVGITNTDRSTGTVQVYRGTYLVRFLLRFTGIPRGLSKDGSKKELSALCFAASCMKFPNIPSTSHILKQNELDYEKLLHVDDEVIPDPLSLHSGWVEEKFGLPQWSPVYITDIASFLASNQSMLNKYKIGKAYEYCQSGLLQQIYYHHISNSCLNYILYVKCTPSQKLKEDSHTVWVCCAKDSGAVKSAYCTCSAGLGSTYNHVAGLLFRVEAANKMGYTSCTSIPCSWTQPSKKHKTVIPIKLKDMTITKSRHGETDKRPLTAKGKASFNPVQGAATNIDKNEMLSTFATALREALPNSCLNRGTVYRDEHISAEESPKITIQDFTMSALL
ncbi:uncharacterized protein [Argopecten irradians]|uniref:uncharacterized protein n=1 Tax=Argopecten irradians TaxID=31199 RepID=UPI0037241638